MKWKADSKPKEGDVRVRTKFAWLPIHYYIDTEMYYCWLETYQVKEECILVTKNYGEGNYSSKLVWKTLKREPLFWA